MGESTEAEGGFGQYLASRSRAFAAVEVLADFGHGLDAPQPLVCTYMGACSYSTPRPEWDVLLYHRSTEPGKSRFSIGQPGQQAPGILRLALQIFFPTEPSP